MYILDIIPITNIPKEHSQIYSYFSDESAETGSLVLISFNNRFLKGFVLGCESVKQRKLYIKKSDFALKKIKSVFCWAPVLAPWQIDLVFWISRYYFVPLTAALKVFLPSYLVKRKTAPPQLIEVQPQSDSKPLEACKSRAVWSGRDERFEFYLSKIRSLKKGEQALFLVPEISLIQTAVDFLENEGEDSYAVLSGNSAEKKYFENWSLAKEGKIKILIGVRSAVFAPFKNLKLIIIEQKLSDSYRSWDMRPKYDAREIALKTTELIGAEAVWGDLLPNTENFLNLTKSDFVTNLMKSDFVRFVNMQNEWKKGNFILSEELLDRLSRISRERKKAVLFVNRKGFATNVFCQECGFVFECPYCDKPLVYYQDQKSGNLMCNQCGFKRQESLICLNCGGRKIRYSGIAVQKVKKEIEKNIPNLKVFGFDAEFAKTKKKQKNILDQFLKEKSAALVATGIMFNKPIPKVDLVAIASVDSILNIPNFRSAEKALEIMARTAEMQKSGELLVQTNLADHPLFRYLKSGDLEKFFIDELEARKIMNYPPFSQLVLFESFRLRGERFARDMMERIKQKSEKSGIKIVILNPAVGKFLFKFIVPPNIKKENIRRYFLNDEYLDKRNKILDIPVSFAGKMWKIDVDPLEV